MALRGDRHEFKTDISFFMNETGERGNVVVFENDGSGASMDDPSAIVKVSHSTSGLAVIGVLMNDVVNIDLTRQHLNQHKDEVQLGGKVTILTKGTITSDRVAGTPSGGQEAFYDNAGNVTSTSPQTSADPTDTHFLTARVGRFLSGKDNDGYAKVEIDIL